MSKININGRTILRFLRILGRQGDVEYALSTFGRVYYRFHWCSRWSLVAR